MHPGANREGCFTNNDLAQQTTRMLTFFDILHSNWVALTDCDQHAMEEYLLVSSGLNLKYGGKNVQHLRNAWFEDQDGTRIVQTMNS